MMNSFKMKVSQLIRKQKTFNELKTGDLAVGPSEQILEVLEPRILFSGAPVEVDAGTTEEAPFSDAPVADVASASTEAATSSRTSTDSSSFAGESPLAPTGEEGEVESDRNVTLLDLDPVSAELNQEILLSIADAAAQRWLDSGLTQDQIEALSEINYVIVDTGSESNVLATTEGYTISVDDNGAENGWFLDSTPTLDEEFLSSGFAGHNILLSKVDFLTTILHEQGHVLGLDESDIAGVVMSDSLGVGERRLPAAGAADGAEPGSLIGPHNLVVTNPSFESGLAGWSTVGTVSSSTANPSSGTQHASLSAGGVDQAIIETALGITSGALDTINGNGDATNGSAISQSMDVEAGDILKFDFRFIDAEGGSTFYRDFAFFSVGGTAVEIADTVTGAAGYTTYTHTFATAGTFTVGFGVMNLIDTAVSSSLEIDNLVAIPAVDASISDASVAEGGNLAFTVTLSNPNNVNTTISYSTANGTATTGDSDYTALSSSITILAGDTTGVINLPTTGDSKVELNETVALNLTSISAPGSLGTVQITDGAGVGTITNNDSATVSVGDATITEGGNLSFALSLSNPVDVDTIVTYSTSNGTATTGDSDYTSQISQTATILAGQTTGTITIATTGDNKVELDETVGITLTNVSASGRSVSIGDAGGVGTITNNDSATVSIGDASVAEGGSINFALSLSRPVDVDTIVTLSTGNGTATDGDSDYTPQISQTVTILAGQTTGTFTVATTGDNKVELDETINATITNVSASGRSVSIGDANGVGTITNNDSAAVSIGDATITEGGNLSFALSLSRAVDADTTITYSTTNGSATTGDSDYTSQIGQTVTILAGQTTGTITVATTGDSKVELDETVGVTLTNVSALGRSVSIGDGNGVGTITNNDSATITLSDASILEGGNLLFSLSLDNAVDAATTITYSTADLFAIAGIDYTGQTDAIATIAAEALSGTIVVSTTADLDLELDEDLLVTVSSFSASGREGSLSLSGTSVEGGLQAATGLILADESPTTGVTLSGTTLRIDDILNDGTDDTLTISTSGGFLTISDLNHSLGTNIVGASFTANSVTLSTALFTDLEIMTVVGTDSITIGDLTGITGNLIVNGGDGNDMIIQTGDVTLTGAGTVDFTSEQIRLEVGADLVTDTGNINLTATGLTGNGAGVVLDGATITSTSGNIDIWGEGGDSGVYNRGILLDFDSSTMTASSIITGGTIGLLGFGGTTGVHATGVAAIGATVQATGSGSLDIEGVGGSGILFSEGVAFHKGTTIDSGTGDLTIAGSGGNSGNMNRGIMGSTSDLISNGGDIELYGAGDGTMMFGIGVDLTAVDITTTGSGSVTIEGAGASGTLGNMGVRLTGNTLYGGSVNTDNGAIEITGTGGGNSLLNHGIQLNVGFEVASTGTGAVTLTGTSGAGSTMNHGVTLASGASVSSADGDTEVRGTSLGSSSLNNGVKIYRSSLAATGSGNLSVWGTGSASASGVLNTGVFVSIGSMSTASGDLLVTGLGGTGSSLNGGVRMIGATVQSTGSGAITLSGTANSGTTGVSNSGMYLLGVTLDSAGTINVSGIGGGGTLLNHGIYMQNITTPGSTPITTALVGTGALSEDETGNFFS